MSNTNASGERSEVMHTTSASGVRELDRRSNHGIDVTLLWNPRTNHVFVAVEDERAGDWFRIDVDAANALDAFQHPYAYADRCHGEDHALAA
jgi:hypothetical protein